MFDFVRCAQAHHVPILSEGHHHCHQGWVQTHCPRCTSGRSGWHLGFSLSVGIFNCWRCGRIPLPEVLAAHFSDCSPHKLAKEYDVHNLGEPPPPKVRARGHVLCLPPDVGKLQPPHCRYLMSRGFDPEELHSLWGLKGIGPCGGTWAWRILIPLLNHSGDCVSYQARAIAVGTLPRYLTAENAHSLASPKSLLYGEHLIRGDSIIVVEGPTDAWRLGPGAVATLGIEWSLQQAERLRHYHRRFILFDDEITAQIQARKLANWLASAAGTTEIITELKADPADMSADEVVNLRTTLHLV